jgi:hypothetical protein
VNAFRKRALIILAALALLAAQFGNASAQTPGSRYFAETGHYVRGDFLAFYESLSEPDFIFGYPITEAFSDIRTGRLVQYFQRARFEYYPENAEGERVHLAALGSALYQPGPGINFFTPFGCREFDSGYAVCFAFLDFFEQYGGEAIFGQPISGFEFMNGRIIQYFQNTRFEWYPEYPEGQKVSLANLGRVYFDAVPEDAPLLAPVLADAGDNIIKVVSVQPRAFVLKAVTQPDDDQVIYVIVQDQTLSPVFNALTLITITWPGGGAQSITLASDQHGIVIFPLRVQGQPPGELVKVEVQVLYAGLQGYTVTSFRIWP